MNKWHAAEYKKCHAAEYEENLYAAEYDKTNGAEYENHDTYQSVSKKAA